MSQTLKPMLVYIVRNQDIKVSQSVVSRSIKVSRLILARKKLYFNCIGGQHRASECRSNRTCFSCKGKHHTLIYDKKANALLTTNSNTVTQ